MNSFGGCFKPHPAHAATPVKAFPERRPGMARLKTRAIQQCHRATSLRPVDNSLWHLQLWLQQFSLGAANSLMGANAPVHLGGLRTIRVLFPGLGQLWLFSACLAATQPLR